MRTLGVITTIVLGLFTLFGVVLGIRSVPDFKRYLRMRSM
jgi:hypothetical protein